MFKGFNVKLILRIIGGLLLFEGVFLTSAMGVAIFYNENETYHFLITSAISILIGLSFYFIGKNAPPSIGKREGSVIVTFSWICFTLIGMLPFLLSGSVSSVTDAFFETMSGFTTTGATVINDIESLPNSILYWRSLTQWIGGLGIIVISIALLPIFGFSSVQLFSAEATGPTKDKIHPKMSDTAKRLLAIYLFLTISQILLLVIAGMGWFDAINHTFATVATGGFSTKQDSVGYWDSPAIQYIFIFYMFFSGVNFTLFYFLFKRKFAKVFKNEELKFYGVITMSITFLIALTMCDFSSFTPLLQIEKIFRDSLFTVVSLMTTTGFATIDYMTLRPVVWLMLLVIMVIGASAGSTAGGMKVVRVLLVLKYAYYEFKKIIHPNAVFPVRYNDHVIKDEVTTRVLAFIMLYIIIIAIGCVVLAFSGMGFLESIGGMITCISDVGPGFGLNGPTSTFADIPAFSKWFLSFVMLIGRLEVFTVLIVFTPIFWKK